MEHKENDNRDNRIVELLEKLVEINSNTERKVSLDEEQMDRIAHKVVERIHNAYGKRKTAKHFWTRPLNSVDLFKLTLLTVLVITGVCTGGFVFQAISSGQYELNDATVRALIVFAAVSVTCLAWFFVLIHEDDKNFLASITSLAIACVALVVLWQQTCACAPLN